MNKQDLDGEERDRLQTTNERQEAVPPPPPLRKNRWERPVLTKYGTLPEVTTSFIGTFSP